MAGKTLSKLFEFILPKKGTKAGGTSVTNTYEAGSSEVLTMPDYDEFRDDIQSTRLDEDSMELIQEALRSDPDVSAAMNAYLTVADTVPVFRVYNSAGELDREGIKQLNGLLYRIFSLTDYTLGFQSKPNFDDFVSDMRYMLLMRGSAAAELVYDKTMMPASVRVLDTHTFEWMEKNPGDFKPVQSTDNAEDINLDIPTLFYCRFRQDPTTPYTYSYFSACINVIAARQTVINDLYRIMHILGFPRIALEVAEEVIKNRAPEEVKKDARKMQEFINSTISSVANAFSGIRPEQPFAHTSAIKPSMLNDKNPGAALQVTDLVETLNAQNQAALKVVATVLGRGSAGVNTASVESRIFSMNADALNKPLGGLLSRMFTLVLRISGYDGFAVVTFQPSEMRPELELEPQKVMKQSRLLEELSLGLITDDQYHLEMHGGLSAEGVPQLSGTGFGSTKMDTSDVSSNDDPLGRSLTPEGSESAKSNEVRK